jgi:hypothetical protein
MRARRFTNTRYKRGEASLKNGGQGWELFDAYGFWVEPLKDGEQLHVSMLHVPFGPRRLTMANSLQDVY